MPSDRRDRPWWRLILPSSVALVLTAATGWAQAEADDDEVVTATTIESPDGTTTIVPVDPIVGPKITVSFAARGLLDDVKAVSAECSLQSSIVHYQGLATVVGYGQLLMLRDGQSFGDWVEPDQNLAVARFDGDQIEVITEIGFEASNTATEMGLWTHGDCSILLYSAPHVGSTAKLCANEDFSDGAPASLIACVWPGTDPATAVARFKRPGLESFNPATGGLAEAERSTD